MCEGEFCVQRWVLLRIMVATNNHKIDFIYFFNLSASLCRLITSAGWRGGDDKAQTLNIHLPGKPSQTVLSPWPLRWSFLWSEETVLLQPIPQRASHLPRWGDHRDWSVWWVVPCWWAGFGSDASLILTESFSWELGTARTNRASLGFFVREMKAGSLHLETQIDH